MIPEEPKPTMELHFGVTGDDRKRLVNSMIDFLGQKARYLGMPSQAYQLGEYTISKDGTVTGPENADLITYLESGDFIAK